MRVHGNQEGQAAFARGWDPGGRQVEPMWIGVDFNGAARGVHAVGGTHGVYGSGGTYGVYGSGPYGLYGTGQYGLYATGTSAGIYSTTTNTSGAAIYGVNGQYGVYGQNGGTAAFGMADGCGGGATDRSGPCELLVPRARCGAASGDRISLYAGRRGTIAIGLKV